MTATASDPATPTLSPSPAASDLPAFSGPLQVRFTNLSDGGDAVPALAANRPPVVTVGVQVSGGVALIVQLTANGLPAVDEGGRAIEALNTKGVAPFVAELPWTPATGGGKYSLTATALDNDKNVSEATIHVTVVGLAASTPTPLPLTHDQAAAKVTELIRTKYGPTIPAPSLQRFDFPTNPTRSRWIGAAYYKGTRYYVQLFADGHVEWSNGPYADPAHRNATGSYTYCRPTGTVRVLVVFVDYHNTGTLKADALAGVPVVVAWLNGLYTSFAVAHGFPAAPMRVEADASYVGAPPAPGALLSAQQVRSLAGKDPAAYDFVMQIDLDKNGTYASRNFPGVMEPGGGFALQACDTGGKFGAINIWSSVTDARSLQGGLTMDFDHELSHMFGMMDDWPYTPGIAGPNANLVDDWIPYVMFGWTDTDVDGIAEIVDPTPYGTSGPQP